MVFQKFPADGSIDQLFGINYACSQCVLVCVCVCVQNRYGYTSLLQHFDNFPFYPQQRQHSKKRLSGGYGGRRGIQRQRGEQGGTNGGMEGRGATRCPAIKGKLGVRVS